MVEVKLEPSEYIFTYNLGKIILKNDFPYAKGSVENSVKKLGAYQNYLIDWARKMNPQKKTILDVGANIGVHTIGFSKLANQVISFEPVTLTRTQLSRNLLINDITNVKIEPFGLSNNNRDVDVLFKPQNLGATTVNRDIKDSDQSEQIEKISLKMLDDFNLKDIGYIKVDIQGEEYNFLLGAKKTIAESKPAIVLELPIRDKKEKAECKKCTILMTQYGYELLERHNKDCLFVFRF